jgi:hypothetical protein
MSLQYWTVTGRSPPTVNNVTSKLNGDMKIFTNSKQCHFKTKRGQEDRHQWYCWLLVEIFLSSFSFEVTLFTVGRDLPVIIQFWSAIVYCWWRSSCHRLVLKWHCLLLVKIFLSPKLNDDRKISTNSKQCHFKTERWQEDLHQQSTISLQN